jgi:hypothetical protein
MLKLQSDHMIGIFSRDEARSLVEEQSTEDWNPEEQSSEDWNPNHD